MKTIQFVITILFVCFYSLCYSQTNNDSLKQILSSKSFTLIEDYNGDWGDYLDTFTFTVQQKKIKIHWKNPEHLKNGKDLDILFPISELKNLEKIFLDCLIRIKTTDNKSTEHIIYKFNNENQKSIIDDKFTMECHKEFKLWKEILLLEWKKQENK